MTPEHTRRPLIAGNWKITGHEGRGGRVLRAARAWC